MASRQTNNDFDGMKDASRGRSDMKEVKAHSSEFQIGFSRRFFAQSAAAIVLGGLTPAIWANAARANANDKFMTASGFLIQHGLQPEVGSRIEKAMKKKDPALDEKLDVIIKAAQSRNAKTVEEFFNDLPEGAAKETAHKIIFAWYVGALDASPEAEVISFEQALMYQTTKDAMALPTYAFSGPNNWTNVNPPLSAMPDF